MKHYFLSLIVISLFSVCHVDTCKAYDYEYSAFETEYTNDGPRKGVITTDIAGAISKEADDRFTKYANNKDYKAVDKMFEDGELVYLPKGTEVYLVEYGFFLVKIRTQKGQILYISPEHVKFEDPK